MKPDVYRCSAACMAAVGDIPRPLEQALSKVTVLRPIGFGAVLRSSFTSIMTAFLAALTAFLYFLSFIYIINLFMYVLKPASLVPENKTKQLTVILT